MGHENVTRTAHSTTAHSTHHAPYTTLHTSNPVIPSDSARQRLTECPRDRRVPSVKLWRLVSDLDDIEGLAYEKADGTWMLASELQL